MVVLVDESTARAAEILAGALHDQSRSLLLGEKTFGLCGLTQVLPLQDGSGLLMTVANCYTPGGQKISGEGLKPDVEGKKPPETVEHLTSPAPEPGKDPWVQQAVEVLKKGNFSRLVQQGPAS
jgi:C-terminal processing protease CtpA/Prc